MMVLRFCAGPQCLGKTMNLGICRYVPISAPFRRFLAFCYDLIILCSAFVIYSKQDDFAPIFILWEAHECGNSWRFPRRSSDSFLFFFTPWLFCVQFLWFDLKKTILHRSSFFWETHECGSMWIIPRLSSDSWETIAMGLGPFSTFNVIGIKNLGESEKKKLARCKTNGILC